MEKKIKITVIGGGSSYTPELIEGIINRQNLLPVEEVALVDIPSGAEKLETVRSLVDRMVKKHALNIRIVTTFDRAEALTGSSYVITQFRVGGLAGRALDERIPLKHGMVGQETTGAGGFALALRTVPVILEIAREMEKLCPDACLINFTNPSGIVTEAVNRYTNIKCIGLCNVPINMERDIAGAFGVKPEDIYCEFIGLNHLSWVKRVFVKGEDRTKDLLGMDIISKSIVANIPGISGGQELLAAIELLPSPYLSYYYFEQNMIKEEQQAISSGKGTRAEQVIATEKELFELYKNPELDHKPEQLSQRGGSLYSEAAISLIESLHTNSGKVHVLNVMNKGAIEDLDLDSVVETNCIVNSSGAYPIASGKLPEVVKPLVLSVKTYERLTAEAAVTGSRKKALQALLCHPLVHGAEEANTLLYEILDAHKAYLGNFYLEGDAD